MTKLDEIRERHARMKTQTADFPNTHLRPVAKQYLDDIGYLLTLLKSHPANEPPGNSRLVIVRWRDKVSLGQYVNDAWLVRGWVIINDNRCPVETWQELPPA